MKVACTFRIESVVLQSITESAARLTVTEGRKVSQAEVIERVFSGEMLECVKFRPPTPRKLSKKAQLAEQRKAADPVAQNLGREDIDYMNPDELPSAGSIGAKIKSDIEIMRRDVNRPPEVSVADWRAVRVANGPLLKPSERSKK